MPIDPNLKIAPQNNGREYHPKWLEDDKVILAFDPGVTTGVAYRMPAQIQTSHGSVPNTERYMTVALGQYDKEEVWSSIDPKHVGLVLYEEFKATNISSYGLYTVRLIGGIQAICYEHNIPIVRQHPQQRYPFVAMAKKYIKDHKEGRSVIHEWDALSHIFLYEYTHKLSKFDIAELAATHSFKTGNKGRSYRGFNGR